MHFMPMFITAVCVFFFGWVSIQLIKKSGPNVTCTLKVPACGLGLRRRERNPYFFISVFCVQPFMVNTFIVWCKLEVNWCFISCGINGNILLSLLVRYRELFFFCMVIVSFVVFPFKSSFVSSSKQHLPSAAIATVMNIDILSSIVRHLEKIWASLCLHYSTISSTEKLEVNVAA